MWANMPKTSESIGSIELTRYFLLSGNTSLITIPVSRLDVKNQIYIIALVLKSLCSQWTMHLQGGEYRREQ